MILIMWKAEKHELNIVLETQEIESKEVIFGLSFGS